MSIEEDLKKLNIVVVYLTDLAQTWWRCRCEDVKHWDAAIETWKEFQDEFKAQFYPQYAEDQARSKLRRLRHEDAKSLRDHVRKFMELSLQVLSLSEEDGFFTFIDGLEPWAKMELQRRRVAKLYAALTVAESVIEIGRKEEKSFDSNDEAPRGVKKPSSGNGKPKYHRQKRDERGPIKCYLCHKEGHITRDCPVKGSFAAVVCHKKDES
ncbi:hypothetical protein HRI_003234000 [Hibiscus trionum]|uniref:CCHC-type domain-containing protein n=1 Tax=Hibiscus trionum TaxID=183268 RepID=A0A9W7IIA2_HIBTR|nr:hypothetical protein HRI_003234000 [Hibiscus trionum]